MKNRTIGHRTAEVGAKAAVHGHRELESAQQALIVEADLVAEFEGMSLAGNQKVVVTVEPKLDRASEFVRRHRCPDGDMASLRFLAAKAAAHASALDAHRVAAKAQRMGDPVLDLAGVLRAGMDQPLALFLRQRQCNLTLEVKMLLAADRERAAELVRRAADRQCRITTAHEDRRQHIAFGCQCRLDAEDRRQRLDLQLHPARCTARLHHAVGDDQPDDLAYILDPVDGENRLVACKRCQHSGAGNVVGQHQAAYAGHRQRRIRVDPYQPAMRHSRQDGRRKQRSPRFGDIVDIGGGTGYLRASAFVRHRTARRLAVAQLVGEPGCSLHGTPPARVKDSRLMFSTPWLSSQ